MRVIAGRFGGRRLASPAGPRTRPTADRVKEALFSMLGSVEGASVLDLFAGTGALGIEALSRGASSATFVERDDAALKALRENLRALGLDSRRAQVRAVDVRSALKQALREGERYELVFLDPPYESASDWGPQLALALPPLLSAGARIVVESDRRRPLSLPLPVERQRRYGDTSITIHQADDD